LTRHGIVIMILVYSITVTNDNEEEQEYRFLNINEAHGAMLYLMQHGCDFQYMEREVHESSRAYPKIISKQPLLMQQIKEWCDVKKDIKLPEIEITPVKKTVEKKPKDKKKSKEEKASDKKQEKTSDKKLCSYVFSRGVNKGKQCNTVCVENKETCKLHTK
jgi:hypothetical protein